MSFCVCIAHQAGKSILIDENHDRDHQCQQKPWEGKNISRLTCIISSVATQFVISFEGIFVWQSTEAPLDLEPRVESEANSFEVPELG